MNRDFSYRPMGFIRTVLRRGLLVALVGFSLGSCMGDDYFDSAAPSYSDDGFQLMIGGELTRSTENDAILDNMRLYCFDRSTVGGSEPELGSPTSPKPAGSASLLSAYHHVLHGLTRNGNLLKTNQMRVGKWDMVMVSGQGVNIQIPYVSTTAGKALMYTFDPADNGGKAHEFYHRYHRLPEITQTGRPSVLSGVSRNVAKVQITVDRAVDIDAAALEGTHTVKVFNAPKFISWAGTLLKSVSDGYQTSTSDFDVVTPLDGSFTFTAGAEVGTYTSDMLTFVIPAHRSVDFWQADGQSQNMTVTDTITKHLSLELNFARPGGRPVFTKTVDIERVPRCNQILDIHIKMKDSNVEITSDVLEWSDKTVSGDVGAPYLNVSNLETEVCDAAASRIYFWSNQPDAKVYVELQGRDGAGTAVPDMNTVFDRLAGAGAVNRVYDAIKGEGYIDIAQVVYNTALPNDPADPARNYVIRLHAGGLTREIKVRRYVSAFAEQGISTPYVGTFHRWNECGERVVTWENTGVWTATVEGAAADQVLIDRQPSPSMIEGNLYGYDPGNAERNGVSDDHGVVHGFNRVYFRVGWKSNGDINTPRYARIKVATETGEKILYLRQGEAAAPVYDGQQPFLPYNVGKYDAPGHYPNANQGLVTYPTQQGYYYQWGATTPYSPDPAVSYPGWDSSNRAFDTDVCPAGYRYPTKDEASTLVSNSQDQPNKHLNGYYADGFFDRRSPGAAGHPSGLNVVGAGDKYAYRGNLYYNTATNASLFLPIGGDRSHGTGDWASSHRSIFWTSTLFVPNTIDAIWYYAYTPDSGEVNHFAGAGWGFTVRCVAVNTVSLRFNGNSHSGGTIPADISAPERERIVIPDGIPTREGYDFKGWTLNADGSGTVYYKDAALPGTEGHLFMPTGGATLYAKWALKVYTHTWYNRHGGVVATVQLEHGARYSAQTFPQEAGINPKGWLYTPEGHQQEANPYPISGGDYVATTNARWDPCYTAWNRWYSGYDGNSLLHTDEDEIGRSYPTRPALTRVGYTFSGWKFVDVHSGGADNYLFPPNSGPFPYIVNKNWTAQWNINTYTATFNSNGGTPNYPNQTTTYQSAWVSPGTPTRTGYTFIEWRLIDGRPLSSVVADGDYNFTAIWDPKVFRISDGTTTVEVVGDPFPASGWAQAMGIHPRYNAEYWNGSTGKTHSTGCHTLHSNGHPWRLPTEAEAKLMYRKAGELLAAGANVPVWGFGRFQVWIEKEDNAYHARFVFGNHGNPTLAGLNTSKEFPHVHAWCVRSI